MQKMHIPPLKVHFSESDRSEILSRIDRCLANGRVAQGENIEEFETRFAQYLGCKHAVALSSGGSALEAAMWALDVRDKEVLIPTNTFLATASGVLAAGGTVKLVDIDPFTIAPSTSTLSGAIGPNTAGVIIVHIGGVISHELAEIRSLCERTGMWLFEDCAHAHGSALDNTKAGLFGVGGAYSFFSTKVITSGEGGMLVTNDDKLADRVRLLRNYGKRDPWVTYCEDVGMNWRLNELAAIIGTVHLRRLDQFIEWREKIASLYTSKLAGVRNLRTIQPWGRASWYKYIVVLPPDIDRNGVKAYAEARGVRLSAGVYDLPLHRQPVAAKLRWQGDFPGADAFCDRHICLPLYYGMTNEEAEYVAETVKSVVE